MLTAVQKQAEKDIPVLEGNVRDLAKELAKSQEAFSGKSFVDLDPRSPEATAVADIGFKHDIERQKLQLALSAVRGGVDRDAKSDVLPERGEKVGGGTDRGFKAALQKMRGSVDDILEEGAQNDDGAHEGEGTYAKAARELAKGSDKEAMGSFRLGELVDRDGAKALITRGQGGLDNLVQPERQGLVDASPFESYTILDLLATASTNQNSIQYPTFLGRSGNAAVIPDPTSAVEAGATLKPDIGLGFGIVDERMRTIAAGLPVHRNSLDDVPQIRSTIEEQLPLAVRAELQAQILSGSGTGENFLGVRNRSGITVVARNAAGSESNVDSIHRTLTQLRLVGNEPTCIVLNPLTWEAMRLQKNTQGDYYYGAPAIVGAPTLWGKLVITDVNCPLTEALVVDWRKVVLFIRSGLSTRASDSHKNFFMLNLVQFLCEGRFGLKTERPSAIGKTTTLA